MWKYEIRPLTCASVLNLYKIKFKYFNKLKVLWRDFLQSDRMKYLFNTNKRSKVIALVKCCIHLCWPYANYMKSHCVHPIVFINCSFLSISTAFVLFCRLVFMYFQTVVRLVLLWTNNLVWFPHPSLRVYVLFGHLEIIDWFRDLWPENAVAGREPNKSSYQYWNEIMLSFKLINF